MDRQDDTPRIPVDSPMAEAWLAGVKNYQPVFRDLPTEEERGLVEVSLKNLRTIVKSGAEVCCIQVGKYGTVFVSFLGGQSYLATGFAVGEKGVKAKGLAEFAAEVGLGTAEKIHRFIAALPDDFEGPIEFPVAGDVRIADC